MKTILEIIKLSTEFLQQKKVAQPRRQAEEIIADALEVKRLVLYLEFDRPLTTEELDKCRSALMRRSKGEPLQYIRGDVDFHHCTFKVSPAVLIPRQETEILVDLITKQLEKDDLANKSFWDICCGSGCIGISIKKKFPQLNVYLSDVSAEALMVAKENAQNNQVDVHLMEGDLLGPFKGLKTDYLACNPPYISEKEYIGLDPEVREHEPKLALVGGSTGLEYYHRLASDIPISLNPKSKIWFEIGYNQGSDVLQIFSNEKWTHRRVEKDWSGHDRFFFLENE